MATPPDVALDTQELMQLAVRATAADDLETAMLHLKRVLALDADHAMALYLLGAVHAQLGLLDRAIDELARACELDGELWTAHFQRGLILAQLGRTAEAAEAWSALDALDASEPLFLFKRGMLRFAEGETAAAVADLEIGLARCEEGDPLVADVAGILEEIRRSQRGEETLPVANAERRSESPDGSVARDPDAAAARRALLSRYDPQNG